MSKQLRRLLAKAEQLVQEIEEDDFEEFDRLATELVSRIREHRVNLWLERASWNGGLGQRSE